MLYGPLVTNIYDWHIDALNDKKKADRYEGHEDKFHASSVGRCILMQKYTVSDVEPRKPEAQKLRLFRLGDLIHEDIQTAIQNQADAGGFPGVIVLIEEEINIPEWNVRGFFDIAFYHEATGVLEVVDIKSAASYSWSKTFGRDKKPTNGWYEKQLMTYGIGLEQSNLIPGKIKTILHSNVWYKKENSAMKHNPISAEAWRQPTIDYWTAVYGIVKSGEKLIAGETHGCPFYLFECNGYCDYAYVCRSPLIRPKKK